MATPPELTSSSSGSDDDLEKGSRGYARSESVQSSSTDALLTETTQLLKLETITDHEARVLISVSKFVSVACIILAIVTCALKESRPELFVLNKGYAIFNVCWNGAGIVILLFLFVRWGVRILQSWYYGMQWSARRLKAVQNQTLQACKRANFNLTVIVYFEKSSVSKNPLYAPAFHRSMLLQYSVPKIVVALVTLGCQMTSNILLVISPSDFCTLPTRQLALAGAFWGSWYVIMCLVVIDAHGTNLKQQNHRTDGSIRDEPFQFHWPKLLFLAAVFGWDVWVLYDLKHGSFNQLTVTVTDGGECTWGASVQCEASTGFYLGSVLAMLALLIGCFMFYWYLGRAFRQLRNKLYQKYRLGNMLLRMQLRTSGSLIGTVILSMLLNWFVGRNVCANFAVIWFGTPSLTLAFLSVSWTALYVTQPRGLRSNGKHQEVPMHLMQQFAWAESDVSRKLKRRNGLVRQVCPVLMQEPMFCVEHAIKSFFWSALVYDYTEADGATFEKLPESIRELMGEIEAAMQLFGLSKRHMFYDRERGTKVVIAWSADVILLSVRGSAERANFIEDAKFLRTVHQPRRRVKGGVPMVHQGFQESWSASGIRTRVLAHIDALLESADYRSAVQIYCTGHSLGGAVASLAAFDIARELEIPPDNMKLYTFGCPRVGNRPFAHEFLQVVPDTWHIINDQDLVTRILKFFGMYKRHGHRVIVNSRGDMVVRPSMFELSMQQAMRGGAVAHHSTVAYQEALVSIVTSQLSTSGRHADGLHGLLGLLKGVPQVKIALEAHARQLGTTLADVMRGVGVQTRRSLADFTGAPSQRFTASRRMSLLRAAGVESLGLGQKHAAHGSNPVSPTGSQASSANSELVAPVAQLADFEGCTLEDGVVSCGNEAIMSPGTFAPTDLAQETEEEDVGVSIHASKLPTWRKAARALGTSHFLSMASQRGSSAASSTGDRGKDSAEPSSTANGGADMPPVHHRCYKIPEDEAATAGADEAASTDVPEAGNSVHSWHNPLSAKKCNLPCNAMLDSNILEIGAKPDMKSCRYGRCKMENKLSKAAHVGVENIVPDAHNSPSPTQGPSAQRDEDAQQR